VLISIRETAGKIEVNKSTLSRQVESGAVRSHDGKVVLAEVVADRKANVDLAQSRRRPAKPKAGKGNSPTTLAMRPIRIVLFNETNKYPLSACNGGRRCRVKRLPKSPLSFPAQAENRVRRSFSVASHCLGILARPPSRAMTL
jgi:hypothetical protein